MIAIGWVISVLAALYIGYLYRDILEKLKRITYELQKKKDAKKLPEVAKSMLVDPLDPIQQSKEEYNRVMKQLNPDLDE